MRFRQLSAISLLVLCSGNYCFGQADTIQDYTAQVKQLSADDPEVTSPFIEAEIKRVLFKNGERQLAPLVGLLKNENWAVRRAAIEQLGYYSDTHAGDEVAKAIAPLLLDPVWHVRETAARAIAKGKQSGKPAISWLVASIDDPREEVRVAVFKTLERLGPDAAPSVPRIVQLLKDTNGETDYEPYHALKAMGAVAKVAIPILKEITASKIAPSDLAAETLGGIGARDVLLKFYESEDSSLSNKAIRGFGGLTEFDPVSRPGDATIQQILIDKLKDKRDFVKRDALKSLSTIRPTNEKISAAIATVLDNDAQLRIPAASALEEVEPKFSNAIASLVKATEDPDDSVRNTALRALKQYELDPIAKAEMLLQRIPRDLDFLEDDGFSVLKAELEVIATDRSKEKSLRVLAILVLAENRYDFTDEAEDQDKKFIEVFNGIKTQSNDKEILAAISVGLQMITNEPEQAAATLINAYSADQPEILRLVIARELGRIQSKPAVDGLVQILDDPSPVVVETASGGFLGFQKSPDLVVTAFPKMTEILDSHPSSSVRSKMILVIGYFDAGIKFATPQLVAAIEKNDFEHAGNVAYSIAVTERDETFDAAPFIKPLVRAYKADKERGFIFSAFGQAGDAVTPEVIEILGQALEDKDHSHTVECAAAACAGLGTQAKSLGGKLLKLIDREDRQVAEKALQALASMKLYPDQVLAKVNQLYDSSPGVCLGIAEKYDQHAVAILPKLKTALKENDYFFRTKALDILSKIGPQAKSMVPALQEMLKSEDDDATKDKIEATIRAVSAK